MIKLVYKLYKFHLFTPKSLIYLKKSIRIHGKNLLAIIYHGVNNHPNKLCLSSEEQNLTYREVYENSLKLSFQFIDRFGIDHLKNVCLISKNHTESIQTLIALSALGCTITILNNELSSTQLKNINETESFDLLIYDFEIKEKVNSFCCTKITTDSLDSTSINQLIKGDLKKGFILPKITLGKIRILTGGTSGVIKFTKRTLKPKNYYIPFLVLVKRLKLYKYNSVYISVPLNHGYGLSSLIISLSLGVTIHISKNYDTTLCSKRISDNKIGVIILVPTILKRLLAHNSKNLQSLKCIITGGAKINSKLVIETQKKIGSVLYNLYGTSETGFTILADPKDLQKSPETIGKKITGVSLNIIKSNLTLAKNNEIGQFAIKNKWSMNQKRTKYILTGDLGYKSKNGFFYLLGRVDDMIVSGGENVFPHDVEKVLTKHPDITDVAIIGINDSDFGKRLCAFIVDSSKQLTELELRNWLHSKITRFQIPKHFIFIDELPFNTVGKIQKAKLEDVFKNKTINI